MNASALRQWLADYEGSMLREGATNPPQLSELANRAGAIVASDAPRAQMSARVIAADLPITTSALLREIPMFIPELGGMKLPVLGWALVLSAHAKIKGRWTLPNAPEIQAQASEAAKFLIDLANRKVLVVAVVHANIRVELARLLASREWECNERTHRYAHWSSWHFRPGTNFPAWQKRLR